MVEENEIRDNKWYFWKKWCANGCSYWCRKYFCEGQLHRGAKDEVHEQAIPSGGPFSNLSPTRRKLVALILPASVFQAGYWVTMAYQNMFYAYLTKYPMSIAMIFASLIAGMTSVSGGAIAFPVMTLVMKEPPAIARDVAISMQACGLTAATFSILFMKIHIEMHALFYGLLGSTLGLVFGFEVVDNALTPPVKKMGFVSIFFAFAFVLFIINRDDKRKTYNNIPALNWWRRLLLFCSGFIGGVFTSFAGSGVDICIFSILTLFFKVSEKVATPTSVVLMAMTSVLGLYWRVAVTQKMPLDSWEYLLVTIPVITIGAPVGALIGSHFHRLVLAVCVYVIDTVALIGAFVIVPQTPALAGGSVATILGMCAVFYIISKLGDLVCKGYEREVQSTKQQDVLMKVSITDDDVENNNELL